ncbi:hypothetical protein M23134_03863 [Microscilla marina ATCC 23134]|uniref:Uncharacterized protein n=1 Tax=Microscilla marina ATCC 23134 TaxID=313606 RepID=A1ZMD2_MICM2|nr:hypothetical protein M23134_03863 [Microscilla marina ATCC 23134]
MSSVVGIFAAIILPFKNLNTYLYLNQHSPKKVNNRAEYAFQTYLFFSLHEQVAKKFVLPDHTLL